MFRKYNNKIPTPRQCCYITFSGCEEFYKNINKENWRWENDREMLCMEILLTKLINEPQVFTFQEQVLIEDKQLVELFSHPNFIEYKHKFSLVFNKSEEQIKELIETKNSVWHGKKFVNPEIKKQIRKQLIKDFICFNIDIQNEQTMDWEQYFSINKKNYKQKECIRGIESTIGGLVCKIV